MLWPSEGAGSHRLPHQSHQPPLTEPLSRKSICSITRGWLTRKEPSAAFIDVRCLGFYSLINKGGEAGTHLLDAACTASPALRGSPHPGLQTAAPPRHPASDPQPRDRAVRPGGEAKTSFPSLFSSLWETGITSYQQKPSFRAAPHL